ncbi:MAG: 2TM domain-containing protein [Pseudomonadota bacterium]
MDSQQKKIEDAKKQVAAMTGFYVHLTIYALVIGILAIVDALTGTSWWVQWPALGWGIGVLAHAIGVFGQAPSFIANWQARKVHELANKN